MTKQKILITGGTKGLGLATAKILSNQDSEVFLTYRNDHKNADAVKKTMNDLGISCTLISCDLSEPDSIHKLFDEIEKQTDTLDIYIHNAAATAFKPLLKIEPHHIDKTFNITVKSFILGTQRAAKLMSNGGAIVSISGMDNLKMVPKHGLLGAAKSALETLTAYFAHELAQKNIRVNSINPGFFKTESTEIYLGEQFEIINQFFAMLSPTRREPKLEEFAKVIQFLVSKDSSWIVGQTIKVDGGQDFSLPVMPS